MKSVYYKSDTGETQAREVVLLVTQSCNLNCKYCYESFKSPSFMSSELCMKILRKEFQLAVNDPRSSSLAISFLGGEPLLNFELIRNVSEWLWSEERELPYSLDIRTNGTLMVGDVKEWFFRNRDRISVALSLDGLSEAQLITRTDKFIDYKFFAENWPKERVKIVLFKDTLPIFAKTIKEMVRERVPIVVEMGTGFRWSGRDTLIFEEQLESLMEIYVDDLQEARTSGIFPFDVGLFFGSVPERYPFCSYTNNLVSYDTDGTSYKCHMFTPIVIGKEKAEWIKQEEKQMKDIPVDDRCKGCPIFNVCKQCPAMNLKMHDDIGISASVTTFCKMKKVQARACATLFLRHIQRLRHKGVFIDNSMIDLGMKAVRLLKTIPEARYL